MRHRDVRQRQQLPHPLLRVAELLHTGLSPPTSPCSYAGQLVMSGLLQLQVKGWARMIGTRLFALAPALTVAIVSNVSGKRLHGADGSC